MKTTLFVGVMCLFALAGCTKQPRVVTAITYSRDQIKFLYAEGAEQGVIKCKMNPGGALSECRPISVSLEE